jgi:hypothetical protein
MDMNSRLLTVELDGTRYRGAYRIEGQSLIVEAHGLGQKVVDASIVDFELGEPTERLAKLTFAQFIKEKVDREKDRLSLVVQGSTTQISLIGPPA